MKKLIFLHVLIFSSLLSAVEPSSAIIEAFIDGMALSVMENDGMSGAVVTIVKDGEILLSKAYGYADYSTGRMATADTTPFRVASITKLFTWTAVMQLAESGQIDLEADINTYLDFKIPLKFNTPITMKNLLSHTGGFEDSYFGFNETDLSGIEPLEEWIKSHQIQQVEPAGKHTAYSNYGAALAAYIVQRVSGLDFAAYIKQKILNPLGMTNTSLAQPYPEHITKSIVAGHIPDGNRFITDPGIYMPSLGGGSMAATGQDMAAFMIAHLNGGSYNNTSILKKETAGLMHSTLFKNHSLLNGMAHGFYEASSHGFRIISHGGDIDYHHSDLALIPEKNLGIFVSVNSDSAIEFRDNFVGLFLDQFYRGADQTIVPAEEIDLSPYRGSYRMSRRGYKNIMKLATLIMNTNVREKDGMLEVSSSYGPVTLFSPVSKEYFSEYEGNDNIGFTFDEKGRVTTLVMDSLAIMNFEKTNIFTNPGNHYKLLICIIITLALFLAGKLSAFCYGRFFRMDRLLQTRAEKRLKNLNIASAVLILIFSIGLILILTAFVSLYMNGEMAFFAVFLIIPFVIIALTFFQIFFLVRDWHQLILLERIQYTVVTVASVLFLWFASVYNLIGWNLL